MSEFKKASGTVLDIAGWGVIGWHVVSLFNLYEKYENTKAMFGNAGMDSGSVAGQLVSNQVSVQFQNQLLIHGLFIAGGIAALFVANALKKDAAKDQAREAEEPTD